MIGNIQSKISKNFALILATFALSGIAVLAQDKISPVSDYQYKKDYAQYEDLKKEADLQKRADLLIGFVKARPISRMLLYAATDYLQCVQPSIEKKDFAKAIAMEEAFQNLMPTEKSVKDAQVPEPGAGDFLKNTLLPAQKAIWMAMLQAYYQANNLPKAAETGEKYYAAAPEDAMAATLSDIYLRMQNFDKYLQYGNKILAAFPIDKSYPIALQMAQVYFQKQDVTKGMELLSKVVEAFPDKTPQGLKEDYWNGQRAIYWSQKAVEAYKLKDYPKAIELYEKTISFSPKGDDSFYYYLGMSKWNNKDMEAAVEPFAKCVVMNKTFAAKAKGYMEDLWKARHNNTLDGLDAVLAKAKSDLGIN